VITLSNKEWLNDEYVKRWLTGLKERTAQNYKERFPHWLEFIDMTPEQQIKKRMHDVILEDITERQFFELKFREYKEYLETKDIKGSTVTTELTCISSFFTRNGLSLNLRRGDWKANVTQEPIKKWKLALDDVKRLYGHANLRDKALLLVLSQSGFSEVDVSEFKVEHLKGLWDMPQTEHFYIEKCREKTGFEQATCISYEALHDIRAMLDERGRPQEGYLFVSQTKGKGEGIDTRTINEAMKALAIRTFGKEKAEEFHTKALRSFYNSALLRARISPQELKDVLMGHKRQGARGHYSYDEFTIKEAYVEAFEHLSINGIQSREDINKIKENLNTLIGQQQVQIEEQKTELKSLKDLMGSQGAKLEELSKALNAILPELEASAIKRAQKAHPELKS
jgi:integrase